MIEEIFTTLQTTFFIATIPAAVGFPFWYHLKMRWRSSEMGRHVMAYSSVVALLYVSGVVQIFLEDKTLSLIIKTVLSLLMMIVVWWRVIVFVHVRRRVMQERAAQQERPSETGLPGVQP